jgi:hypothetical protein
MDLPVNLAPGHAVALIKSVSAGEQASGLVLSAGGGPAVAGQAMEGDAGAPAAAGRTEVKEEFTPASSWTPIEDATGGYQYSLVDAEDCLGKKIKIIQDSADPGQAEGKNDWREKIKDRDDMLRQVKTDLHYWYAEGYGSEKRKKPA